MSHTEIAMESRDKPAEFRRTVGRNATWSLVQTVISALTVFALYKYLYGYLGPEQLGLWAVVLASVSLGRLAELGFSTTVLRYVSIHLGNGNRTRAAQILETGVVTIGVPFALALLILYPMASQAMRYVLPASNIESAREILPYALATLWFGVTGSIAQSALDGCGRMDVKSRILIVGNLAYVPAAILMAQQWGITGLAICQLLQSVIVAILVWISIRRELPHLSLAPVTWNKSCFREILSYAAGLQLGNLLIMLFEPATKIVLSRYCGLAEVAHFEMANQVVSRVRALITSAMQAYLPSISSTSTDANSVRQIVGEATTFAAGIGLPLMAGVVVSFPIISILWIGEIQPNFIAYGWILGIGWLIATLAMPVYFFCVGTGRVKTILLSHVITVGSNIFLGFGAAVLGLGHGVAISMMVSLCAGNLMTVITTLSNLQISARQLIKLKGANSVIRTVALTGFVLVLNIGFSIATSLDTYLYANFLINALGLLLIIFMSDARLILASKYQGSR